MSLVPLMAHVGTFSVKNQFYKTNFYLNIHVLNVELSAKLCYMKVY